jgi:hypothetical protein
MKRKVKYFKRTKQGKTYHYPWIGYSFRNKNGNPDFKREVNLSELPEDDVVAIDTALRCAARVTSGVEEVEFLDSVSIGAEWTALRIAEQLGIVAELERLDEKYRQAVMCMILDRVVNPRPYSKSALFNALPGSGLERVLAPDGLEPKLHDFYVALEKLYEAQPGIQRGLFSSRTQSERMFLYDITSSYVEGQNCPLAAFGHNRDGKKGKKQIVIGLLTDSEGLPMAVEVFEGNTSDQTTVMGQIEKLRVQFGIEEMVFIGDRGMLTSARRKDLQAAEYDQIKYISALTRSEMFRFIDDQNHPLQLGLFDRQNLAEIEHEGVRYVLCFNPDMQRRDQQTRMRLIERTEEKLEMIRRNAEAGKWKSRDVIATRLYRWINRWGMERFFKVEYGDAEFSYERDDETIQEHEALDGCYVIVSDTASADIPTEKVRSRYKSLAQVEQAFRTMKSTELYIRPLRHWNPQRVKGHVFLCMLSYMIVWQARRMFQPFIAAENDIDSGVSADSLRDIWDTLNQVKIGIIKIGKKVHEQLKPLSGKVKSVLKSAGASLTKKAAARLGFVG